MDVDLHEHALSARLSPSKRAAPEDHGPKKETFQRTRIGGLDFGSTRLDGYCGVDRDDTIGDAARYAQHK